MDALNSRYDYRDSTYLKVALYSIVFTLAPYFFTTFIIVLFILVYFYEVEYKNLTILKEVKFKGKVKEQQGVLESYDTGVMQKEGLKETVEKCKELLEISNKGKVLKTEKYNNIIKDIKYTGNYRQYKVSILKHLRAVTYIPLKDLALIYKDKNKRVEHFILWFIGTSSFVFMLTYLYLDLNYTNLVLTLQETGEEKKFIIPHSIVFMLTILNILNVKFILVDKYLERRQDEVLNEVLTKVISEYDKRLA